ncbi:hypothetical protein [Actinomadura harenae]|uniref:Uncharacterized protein n=1 Tax=Actinomadura harenae TaxID=2483351 RepID=A0A3M2M4M6_9ACTN|nr:hypothetical protein [Actinomadura harenae]RMI42068.1 hypothetical protein EBO15_20655 [Actinomadura harenae]
MLQQHEHQGAPFKRALAALSGPEPGAPVALRRDAARGHDDATRIRADIAHDIGVKHWGQDTSA